VTVIPIAIIGMAARTPGSTDLAELWRLLANGTRAIAPVPDNHLPGLDPGPITVDRPRAALMDGVDRFDAAFFRPRHSIRT
jgi:acyl transferase domain-containing protein